MPYGLLNMQPTNTLGVTGAVFSILVVDTVWPGFWLLLSSLLVKWRGPGIFDFISLNMKSLSNSTTVNYRVESVPRVMMRFYIDCTNEHKFLLWTRINA